RLYQQNAAQGFFKDAFHECVVNGNKSAVNSQQMGTKAAAHYTLTVPAGGSTMLRLRLVVQAEKSVQQTFADFDSVFAARLREADEFYGELQTNMADENARAVQRQAFAGMIWSKQYFYYDVPIWLKGDPSMPPPPPERKEGRNADWT